MENYSHNLKYNKEQYSKSKNKDLIDCQCSNCNKNFKRVKHDIYVSLYRKQQDLFCSPECNTDFQKPLNSTTGTPCKNCQTPVKHPNIFCSRKCSAIFNNKHKSVNKIQLTCDKCKKDFFVLPYIAKAKAKNQKCLCSKNCLNTPKRVKRDRIIKIIPYKEKKIINELKIITIICESCGKSCERKDRKKKNKSGKLFCSKSCRMTYFNKYHHINKGCSSNRSFPEDFLYDKLIERFNHLNIIKNERKLLKCGYEIDIYFPELKFGIEINGPVHYMPIFGEEKLQRVQFKDSIKYAEMNEMGISFLVIDVSKSISKKKMSEYLLKQLNESIFPIIEFKLEEPNRTA